MIAFKSSSCGITSFVTKFTHEVKFKFLQKMVFINKTVFNCDFPVIIGQISLVDIPEIFLAKLDELKHVFVSGERLSDIIDLFACISHCGVREEDNEVRFINLRCDVDEFPFWRFPDAMKLGFNQDSSPDMNAPANLLFSSIGQDMLWNDSKTFIHFIADNWKQWNKDWLLF